MKQKILSVVLLASIIAFVTVNTIILRKQIDGTINEVKSLSLSSDEAKADAEDIYNNFMKNERYISITTTHNDLTSIEDCFVEMIGYISVGDIQNAYVTKCRLISYLEHLRRLSGFNFDAII